MNDHDHPTLLFIEHVLWTPGGDWDSALAHLAIRFSRATPLDDASIRSAGALADQLEALAAWARDASVDLDRELGRWFDEHLSMHVRPAPVVTRAVRALAAAGPIHLASALPPRAAEAATRHAGCWRSVTELHGDVRDGAALGALVARLQPRVVVAGAPTPAPAGVQRTPLAEADAVLSRPAGG